jgi:hypothetical protein
VAHTKCGHKPGSNEKALPLSAVRSVHTSTSYPSEVTAPQTRYNAQSQHPAADEASEALYHHHGEQALEAILSVGQDLPLAITRLLKTRKRRRSLRYRPLTTSSNGSALNQLLLPMLHSLIYDCYLYRFIELTMMFSAYLQVNDSA